MISTGILGIYAEFAYFRRFLGVSASESRDFSGFRAFQRGRGRSSKLPYFSPKSTVLLGAIAAAMGVFSASTTGAATLK